MKKHGDAYQHIVIIRSYVPQSDARLNRTTSALQSRNKTYSIIGWARGGAEAIKAKNHHIFQDGTSLGGGVKSSLRYLLWYKYVARVLYGSRKEFNIIQSIDLDSAIIGFIFAKIFRKVFIFEIYDNFASSRNIGGVFSRFLDCLERFISNRADLCIIASEDRFDQNGRMGNNFIVLENVPNMKHVPASKVANGGFKSLGYFGVLEERHRGLEDIIKLAEQRPELNVKVAGYGPLEKQFRDKSRILSNLHFYGELEWNEGILKMSEVDVIFGLYYLSNKNHKYAAPNKYYEHLMLGKGLISTVGTPPGQKVELLGTGWAIEEGFEPLLNWVENITIEDIRSSGERALQIWKCKYKDYYRRNYVIKYVDKIESLCEENGV